MATQSKEKLDAVESGCKMYLEQMRNSSSLEITGRIQPPCLSPKTHSFLNLTLVYSSGVKAASGIKEQPFGHDDTLLGAKNRLNHAIEATVGQEFDIIVAIESGIIPVGAPSVFGEETMYYDIGWVVVKNVKTDKVSTT